ncbi:putative alpha/beta hydrolase [Rhizobium sp. BK619]|uniref:alpha/beta hydrolase family protein n=1 Tax=Rhizobium sp. BK619 TaxID=2586989 RepID=UPI00160E5EAC|nr:alpha/beta fold hydrolase [Rhizobium sp. BK619]MBB3649370.1 putative alpha/beta hydrolase [Rhizobium sp. BK619]
MAEGADLPPAEEQDERPAVDTPVEIRCSDGVMLGGHLWTSGWAKAHASVIINPATGVLARYYHRYAQFLTAHGFDVLTYDYRGIGLSRPARLRGCGYRWREWGEKDFDAALRFIDGRADQPLYIVGHSIGGFLPGLSKHAGRIDRMLTMGAQYAYWRDYAPARRMRLLMKWHVAMPALTALFGYFPGKRLGWLEDLPAGVAHEWSFRRARMEMSHPAAERDEVLKRFAAVTAPILAVAMSDDELGTVPAIRRTLAYYRNAEIDEVLLQPADLGFEAIGHFGLFHSRHCEGFWRDSVLWLRDGIHPWPAQAALQRSSYSTKNRFLTFTS